nr:hypothetical protein CFP56_19499 [Quercus suber]
MVRWGRKMGLCAMKAKAMAERWELTRSGKDNDGWTLVVILVLPIWRWFVLVCLDEPFMSAWPGRGKRPDPGGAQSGRTMGCVQEGAIFVRAAIPFAPNHSSLMRHARPKMWQHDESQPVDGLLPVGLTSTALPDICQSSWSYVIR